MIKYSGIYQSTTPPTDTKVLWVDNGTLKIFKNGWKVVGEQEDIKVKAENIIGQINQNQIASVPGSRIDAINASQIKAGVLGSNVKLRAEQIVSGSLPATVIVEGVSVRNLPGSSVTGIPPENLVSGSLGSNVRINLGSSVQMNASCVSGVLYYAQVPGYNIIGSIGGSAIVDLNAAHITNVSGCEVGSIRSGSSFVLISDGQGIQRVNIDTLKSFINS